MSLELATGFSVLFAGLARAHGEYYLNGEQPDEKGKLVGTKRRTVNQPVTLELWARHLREDSNFGLGIVPIADDNTCRFGAIDVDIYRDFDIKALAAKANKARLPLVACRTKSGGAHLYLFLKNAAPAALVRRKLAQWAEHLGLSPKTEIFPKQEQQGDDRTGNWINMPYQAGGKTTRYAVDHEGNEEHDPAEFLKYANALSITREQLEKLEPTVDLLTAGMYAGSPPCLSTLAKQGVPAGQRNNAMFNVGIYLKKRFGDNWQQYFSHYNQTMLEQPLSDEELRSIAVSITRKSYGYKCKDQPICDVCDKITCKTMQFGVGGRGGGGADGFPFKHGRITVITSDPPIFVWDIEEKEIRFSVEELCSQDAFSRKVTGSIYRSLPRIKPMAWQNFISQALDEAEHTEAPPEASLSGQILKHLKTYCTGRRQAKDENELLAEKPWIDPADGRVYFSVTSFIEYLATKKITVKPPELWAWLKYLGGASHTKVLKGAEVHCWSLPKFKAQTEAFEVPKKPLEEM